MQKLPLSMFKSCKNVSNLAFFVHAKSSLLFGQYGSVNCHAPMQCSLGTLTAVVYSKLSLSQTPYNAKIDLEGTFSLIEIVYQILKQQVAKDTEAKKCQLYSPIQSCIKRDVNQEWMTGSYTKATKQRLIIEKIKALNYQAISVLKQYDHLS